MPTDAVSALSWAIPHGYSQLGTFAPQTVLADRLRALCDAGIRRAESAGRRTLMDRDFR